MCVENDVGGAGAEARRFDTADVGALGDTARMLDDVLPRLAAIARDLQIAIVGAGVQQIFVHWRFADRGDRRPRLHAVVARHRVFVGHSAHDRQLVAFLSGCQIGTEASPVVAAVGRFEEIVAAVVDRLGIE